MIVLRRLGLGGLAAIGLSAVALAQDVVVHPGLWEIAGTAESVDMPGMPAGVANMMVGKTITVKHCITPEEATRGLQDAMKTNKNCSFTHFSMSGGKLESEMVCNQGGSTITVVSAGTATPDGFDARARTVMSGGKMNMTTVSHSVGRRIGDCKG